LCAFHERTKRKHEQEEKYYCAEKHGEYLCVPEESVFEYARDEEYGDREAYPDDLMLKKSIVGVETMHRRETE